jgi:CheY-like chemotaxis protein
MTGTPPPILLVEDDPNDIVLFRRAARQAGIRTEIVEAEDGDAAMVYLEQTEPGPPPRMLLLDLKLPRKTGLEFLAWVRGHPTLRRLPVVVLTSSREPEDIRRAYELGANSYLVKPVSFDQLKDLVQVLHRYWFDWNEDPFPE